MTEQELTALVVQWSAYHPAAARAYHAIVAERDRLQAELPRALARDETPADAWATVGEDD